MDSLPALRSASVALCLHLCYSFSLLDPETLPVPLGQPTSSAPQPLCLPLIASDFPLCPLSCPKACPLVNLSGPLLVPTPCTGSQLLSLTVVVLGLPFVCISSPQIISQQLGLDPHVFGPPLLSWSELAPCLLVPCSLPCPASPPLVHSTPQLTLGLPLSQLVCPRPLD